jgi:hypothetical protein
LKLEVGMKKTGMMMCAVAALVVSGCSTAWVSNEARSRVTSPDGTVTERFAQNRIKAFGDRAVEQNLKGSLADATEADLSAGIQESAQQSESGAVVEFMGRTVETLGRVGEAYLTRTAVPAGAGTNCPGAVCADVKDEGGWLKDEDDGASIEYSDAGYDGVPGPEGEGVYGRPNCSRCRAYKAAHPEERIINVDVAKNHADMLAALELKGRPKTEDIAYPVKVTASGYTMRAK